MSNIEIAGRTIGPGYPVFVIAELSGNHHRNYDTAVELIHTAHRAGADAVKTQCFRPCSMTLKSDSAPFRINWQGQDTTLWDLYSQTAMPMEWHRPLKELTESLGMVYFASVCDREGVDFMDALGVPAFKIASFELIDTPLIRYAASKGKPLILSTGMATKQEIRQAIDAANRCLASPAAVVLLKCTSAYPARASDCNLSTLPSMCYIAPYRDIVGLSDHTLGIAVPIAAVALGACIIEKHLTLSRADGGPDATFSLEPAEFWQMVGAVRVTEQALGEVRYGPTESEQPMLRFRRSLWLVADVRQGGQFTAANVRSLRPLGGLEPCEWDNVIGRTATRDCQSGEALQWEMVAS